MTYTQLATEVCSWIDRSDLVTRAVTMTAEVVNMVTSRVPMYELRATATPSPAAGVTQIGAFDSGYPLIAGIISVRAENLAGTTWRRVQKRNIQWFDSVSRTVTAQLPSAYCRQEGNLELYPKLTEALNFKIRYWKTHPEDGTLGNTTILTHSSWNELYRWETYYRLLMYIGEHDKAAALNMPGQMPHYPGSPRKMRVIEPGIIPRLWNDLLITVDQREGIDDDFGIRPRRR